MNGRIAILAASAPYPVDKATSAFVASIKKLGCPPDHVDSFQVDRVLELSLQARVLASSGYYSAIVVAGVAQAERGYREDFIMESIREGLVRAEDLTHVAMLSLVLERKRYCSDDHLDQALTFAGARGAMECARSVGLTPAAPASGKSDPRPIAVVQGAAETR